MAGSNRRSNRRKQRTPLNREKRSVKIARKRARLGMPIEVRTLDQTFDLDRPHVERIGPELIVRPRAASEHTVRKEAEAHLRQVLQPGRYTASEIINDALKHQYSFFDSKLEARLPQLASRSFIELILSQYDITGILESHRKAGTLRGNALVRWQQLGPVLRRALKYLAEKVTMTAPSEAPAASDHQIIPLTDEVFISAEELVELSIVSEQTYSVAPDESLLIVHPPGRDLYIEVGTTNGRLREFPHRVTRDTRHRGTFIPGTHFIYDVQRHADALDLPFDKDHGIPFSLALDVLRTLLRQSLPPPDSFGIPFVRKDDVLTGLGEAFGVAEDRIALVLSGFSLTKEKMVQEGRVIWKPQQEHRAYRRAIFELPHPTGVHLAWSRQMYQESLTLLVSDLVFGHIPSEWRGASVATALAKLSNEAGKWFERTVNEQLRTVGFTVVGSHKKSIGRDSHAVAIPSQIGEIDTLAYSPAEQLLLISESKMLRSGSDPRYFRSDIAKFWSDESSFYSQLTRKADWVRAHIREISMALNSSRTSGPEVQPKRVAKAIITYMPTIASVFVQDVPCISLTEILLGYKYRRRWPFDIGVLQI